MVPVEDEELEEAEEVVETKEDIEGMGSSDLMRLESYHNISQITATTTSSPLVSPRLKPNMPNLKRKLYALTDEEFQSCLPALYDERLKRIKDGEAGKSNNIIKDIYNETVVPVVEVASIPLVSNQVGIPEVPVIMKNGKAEEPLSQLTQTSTHQDDDISVKYWFDNVNVEDNESVVYWTPRISPGSVAVEQLDVKSGVVISSFHSIRSAAKATGVQPSSISYCCLGQRSTAGGYVWRKTII